MPKRRPAAWIGEWNERSREEKTLTLIVSSTVPEAVIVRFWPGFGGSGETSRERRRTMSEGVPGGGSAWAFHQQGSRVE